MTNTLPERYVDIFPISACQCCMLLHANGECCGDEAHDVEPLSLIDWRSEEIALGGDELGFSWSSCEACGSTLGGDRFEMTVFVRRYAILDEVA